MLQMSTSSSTVSGSTGAVCSTSGPYTSERNAKVTVVVLKGQQFPPDSDGKKTTWSMTVQTQTVTLVEM